MPLVVLLVLMAIPLLEIGVLIKVGRAIGVAPTLAIVIGTAILGVAVVRREGFTAPFRMREAVARGEAPIGTMVDRALVVGAGLLLISPGLIADALGLVLLVPVVRRGLSLWASSRMFGGGPMTVRKWTVRRGPQAPPPSDRVAHGEDHAPPAEGPTIEGDFRRVDERTIDPRHRDARGDSSDRS
jgi:UPF0716 protein FxsA